MNNHKIWDWRRYIMDYVEGSTLKLVLYTLANYMDTAGNSCFPSVETLSEKTGLSKPTVIKHLKKAKEQGWINVKEHGLKGKQWKRHEYSAGVPAQVVKQINHVSGQEKNNQKSPSELPLEPQNTEPEKVVNEFNHVPQKAVKSGTEGGKPSDEGGKTDTTKVVKQVNPNSSVTSTKNSPTNTTRVRVSFAVFFREYDKNVEEEETKRLWGLLSDAQTVQAFGFLKGYKEAQPNAQFRKDPDNYLRERYWEKEGPQRLEINSRASQPKIVYHTYEQMCELVTSGKARSTDEFERVLHPVSQEYLWVKSPELKKIA